jgi:hypothetical protein
VLATVKSFILLSQLQKSSLELYLSRGVKNIEYGNLLIGGKVFVHAVVRRIFGK